MAEDWKLIKEYNLEGVRKRLNEMNEYIVNGGMNEAEDEVQNQEPPTEEQPVPEQQPKQNIPAQEDMSDMENPSNDEIPEDETVETEGEYDIEPEMEETETDQMQPGDEVIDVDELTTSQENTEIEIGTLNKNLKTLLDITNQLTTAISDNEKKVDELRAELEKRNPTPQERTEVRMKQGAPYDSTPNKYWDSKKAEFDKDNLLDPRQEDEKVYEITFDDINSGSDRDIADSMYPTKLSDYLKF